MYKTFDDLTNVYWVVINKEIQNDDYQKVDIKVMQCVKLPLSASQFSLLFS